MRTEAPIAVIDTDVLYSKKSRIVVMEVIARELAVGVWSPYVIAEFFRLITIAWIARHGRRRPSLDRLSVVANKLMDLLLTAFVLVDTGPRDLRNFARLRDVYDLHLIAAGKLSTASLIVSNNVRDFPAPDNEGRCCYDGLEFVTYATFLERLSIDETAILASSAAS